MLPFDVSEYQGRIKQTRTLMEKEGIDLLLITDPANMNYLSGYDAWSFYVHQMLIIDIHDSQPVWVGRFMDAPAAKVTTWMHEANIIGYPDIYVHSDLLHPMAFIAEVLRKRGNQASRIGVEMDHYYFSAKAFEELKKALPDARFQSADLLVNRVRMVKSDQELEYMKKAGKLAELAMFNGVQTIRTGNRECDAAAMIYYHMIAGTKEWGGDYPAIVPLLPTGENTSIPHLTWTDRKFQEGEAVIVELAGCCKRYHVPLARTIAIGPPSQDLLRISSIATEGINRVLDEIKPGMTCGDVEAVWRMSLQKHGIAKESRLGYSVGLNYPPDWGEHTASIRKGDQTVLQPNMTFHIIPGLWFERSGVEISETIRVTETGCETLANYSRELIINSPYVIEEHGEIS
ncbi:MULTISPECIES: M24 family metallopeptidase [Alteribacter]|uniref:M24 family metallopeptidase n=1 Tax=Alteribacter keqinensis TaxID=2483800 RepID=A0A3M7TVS2_9BACI|nr:MULTISPECIES: M24 family metallopeptidase [Alteribacter]MBM7094416.1 M24 family metallopeptidase [Alteribacter salitolerans]RNA69359.1 M24 family metallopeptidase [Alteribacter keqinensis]